METNKKPSFVEEMNSIQDVAKKSKIEAAAIFDKKLQERIKKAKLAAKPIISKIHGIASKAAANNENGCAVMRLTSGKDIGFSDFLPTDVNYRTGISTEESAIPYDKLGVTAKEVFDYCYKTLAVQTYVRRGITSMDERGNEYFDIYIDWHKTKLTR